MDHLVCGQVVERHKERDHCWANRVPGLLEAVVHTHGAAREEPFEGDREGGHEEDPAGALGGLGAGGEGEERERGVQGARAGVDLEAGDRQRKLGSREGQGDLVVEGLREVAADRRDLVVCSNQVWVVDLSDQVRAHQAHQDLVEGLWEELGLVEELGMAGSHTGPPCQVVVSAVGDLEDLAEGDQLEEGLTCHLLVVHSNCYAGKEVVLDWEGLEDVLDAPSQVGQACEDLLGLQVEAYRGVAYGHGCLEVDPSSFVARQGVDHEVHEALGVHVVLAGDVLNWG